MGPKSRSSVLAVALVVLAGCGTFGGILEEARTDATLAPYLRPVRYNGTAEHLARLVLDDLRQHEQWHREHNLIHRLNVAAGTPTAKIVATPSSLRVVEPAIASLRSVAVEAVDEGRRPASAAAPVRVEFQSVRETYVLAEVPDGYMVAVTNRGDGDRLFHRELEFLRRVDPGRGERLRAKILAEHPEVVLDPWQP